MAHARDRSIPVHSFGRAIRGRLDFFTRRGRAKVPNTATRRALKDVAARKGLTRYEDFGDFARAMI